MTATTKITVRLNDPNHPAGKRARAGFVFGSNPTTVQVTPDQLGFIKADPYLRILKTDSKDTPRRVSTEKTNSSPKK